MEQIIYFVRDNLWQYPEKLFTGKDSFYSNFKTVYFLSRPFSHFIAIGLVIILIVGLVSTNVRAFVKVNKNTLVEGVIVGVDDDGQLQKIGRINPLINSNIQLEKDLIELIYEGLVRVDQNGEKIPVMADYLELEKGKLYRFKLKDNLFWQDGKKVTTEDVKATFELLKSLEGEARTSTIYSRAAAKMELNIIDELSFEFKLNSVISAFFEAVSFKILPAHLMSDLNQVNISTSDPLLNRKPVGTGRYQLVSTSEDSIELVYNDKYYGEKPSITKIKFKMFPDEDSAIEAISSGQIHSITGISTEKLRTIQDKEQLFIAGSNVIYNQYWGLYFNLSEDGPAIFKESGVRQAISAAINRTLIIQNLLGYAEEATSPIPVSSFAYTKLATFKYDKAHAEKLLDASGWKKNEATGIRSKSGTELKFTMVLVDNQDRKKIAESIKKDLADVGIEVTIEALNRDQVVNEHIIPRLFDTILYGVQTFIDPDRYELFHSSQIDHPGLNISGYKSSETVSIVSGGKILKISKSDDALDDGRRLIDESARKAKYLVLQNLLAKDVPVVFLYHPRETYVVNRRLKNINLDSINSIEQRFNNISSWKIEV